MVHKAKVDQKNAEDFVKLIGERIRGFRLEQGLSQEKLGERSGLNSNYIGQIERGEKSLSAYTLKKVAEGLTISLEEMFRAIDPIERVDALEEIVQLLLKRPKKDHLKALVLFKAILNWDEN